MISMEYIIDKDKSLLTITFNNNVLTRLKAKIDDYLNFFQSPYKINCLTLFKADTGYRIMRVPKKKKMYKINIRHPLKDLRQFEEVFCTYYVKKNGFIKIIVPY